MNLVKILYLNILIFCECFIVFCKNSKPDQGELAFVHIIYRHGDRTPIDPYPNDPYKVPNFWHEGLGQLTKIGKEQHYELGQYLRKRYDHLLNATSYSKDLVYIQSTDVDRTLMSALSNLAGLFPPPAADMWNPNVSWQPIPVHTIPEKFDHVLAAKRPCPLYDYSLKKYKSSHEYKELNKRFKPLYEYLTIQAGKKVDSFTGVQNLYNTLFIEDLYNLTLPEWTKKVYPEGDMKWIAARSFATNTNTDTLAKLKTGFLLKEILERSSNKTRNKLSPNRSMWVYSAHDTTIANVLNTLGAFDLHSPPYVACIMIELRIINRVPHIQVFYKNTTNENPPALNLLNCGQLCPLSEMYNIYKNVLPTDDFASECKVSMLAMTYEEADFGGSTTGFTVTLIFFSIIIFLIVITVKIYYKYNYRDSRWYLKIDS